MTKKSIESRLSVEEKIEGGAFDSGDGVRDTEPKAAFPEKIKLLSKHEPEGLARLRIKWAAEEDNNPFKAMRNMCLVCVDGPKEVAEVLETLYPLFLVHGKPEVIRSDNGPEFISKAFQTWLTKVGIKPIRIYPGSPWENGYNERFNGTLRREVLNGEWFTTIKQARTVIGKWLRQYNHIRPHQALNMRPPVPETLSRTGT